MSSPSRNNNEIKPALPQMRSVMIGSAPSAAPLLGFPPSMQPLRKAAPATKLQVVTASSPAKTTLQSWNPKPSPLPDFYMLERSNATIAESPSNIANRICDYFQKHSIAGVFEDAKASIEAETADHTCFAVNMFASSKGTIIEVQRLSGCCVSFRESSRGILQAAKGVTGAPANNRRRRGMLRMPPALPPMACQDETVNEAVEINCNMLMNSSKMDAQILGLEGLTQLTSGAQTRKCASKTVLANDELVQELMRHTMIPSDKEETSSGYQYTEKLRRYSLCILANSLESCGPSSKLHQVDFLAGLQTLLDNCGAQPHEACYAAKILTQLAPLGLDNMDLAYSIQRAHDQGRCQHALLAQEALRLREVGM